MIIQNFDNSYTATVKSDFDGWKILAVEDWKPGVKRVHMLKTYPNSSGVFEIVFANDIIAPKESDVCNDLPLPDDKLNLNGCGRDVLQYSGIG